MLFLIKWKKFRLSDQLNVFWVIFKSELSDWMKVLRLFDLGFDAWIHIDMILQNNFKIFPDKDVKLSFPIINENWGISLLGEPRYLPCS
jgi:hypothetical protein